MQNPEIQSNQHQCRSDSKAPVMTYATGLEQCKVFPEGAQRRQRDQERKGDFRPHDIGGNNRQPEEDRAERAGEKGGGE